jgi:hypothetical protein
MRELFRNTATYLEDIALSIIIIYEHARPRVVHTSHNIRGIDGSISVRLTSAS